MLESCIFNLLDHILPSNDKSKHDTLRLEYISSCKVMENGNYAMQILPQTPASLFEPLLKSVIYKYYLDYIRLDDNIKDNIYKSLSESDLAFPGFLNSIRPLILNWPGEELILKNQIPSLDPPVEIFPSDDEELISGKAIGFVEDMAKVFIKFCHILIHFITHAVFKHGFSCKLKKLDISGFSGKDGLESWEHTKSFLKLDNILKEIRNSKIENGGHKIDMLADAEFTMGDDKDFKLLCTILKENSKKEVGIAVYFKTIKVNSSYSPFDALIPSDFCNVLALARCEYIHLVRNKYSFDWTSCVKQLSVCCPKLVGLTLEFTDDHTSLIFLSEFKHLEQLSLGFIWDWRALTNSLSNMSKGLKYLDISGCSLQSENLKCLAKSVHANTLIELNINDNFENASKALGVELLMLCQNLINIKVLHVENCRLNILSSTSVSNLVNAFKDCHQLEFLSMKENNVSLDITNVIIDGLAHTKSLRYLSLNLLTYDTCEDDDDSDEDNSVNVEYLNDLCEKFHDQLNTFRDSQIYISWNLAWGHFAPNFWQKTSYLAYSRT